MIRDSEFRLPEGELVRVKLVSTKLLLRGSGEVINQYEAASLDPALPTRYFTVRIKMQGSFDIIETTPEPEQLDE